MRVLAATEVEAGIEKFQQAQEILFADLPAIPLWYTNAMGAWGEQVDNVEFGWDSWPILQPGHQERVILVQGRLGVRL